MSDMQTEIYWPASAFRTAVSGDAGFVPSRSVPIGD